MNKIGVFYGSTTGTTEDLARRIAEKLDVPSADVFDVSKLTDFNFTASVEKEFDEIAEGEVKWTSIMKNFYDKFHPSVENTLAIKTEHKVGERILGEEPGTGKTVSVKIGRFGPVVQIGTVEDEEKPRFAQMKKGQSMETITLEEALELFKLPRTLGEYEGDVER